MKNSSKSNILYLSLKLLYAVSFGLFFSFFSVARAYEFSRVEFCGPIDPLTDLRVNDKVCVLKEIMKGHKITVLQNKVCQMMTDEPMMIDMGHSGYYGTALVDFNCKGSIRVGLAVIDVEVKSFREIMLKPVPKEQLATLLDRDNRIDQVLKYMFGDYASKGDLPHLVQELSAQEIIRKGAKGRTFVVTAKKDKSSFLIDSQGVSLIQDGAHHSFGSVLQAFNLNGTDILKFGFCEEHTDNCGEKFIELN